MFLRIVYFSLLISILLLGIGKTLPEEGILFMINSLFYVGSFFFLLSLISIVIAGGFFDVQLTVFSPSFRDNFELRLREAGKKLEEQKEQKKNKEEVEKQTDEQKKQKKHSKVRLFIWTTGLIGSELLLLSYLYIYIF